MHHLTCGISSLLHSVNLILLSVLLVHQILHTSPHHSHHLRSHHLSLPRPFRLSLQTWLVRWHYWVAHRTNDLKVAGSRPTKVVCVSQC